MRIAISGAGVAGAALAHWLHRTGHTPTLIEQAPHLRTGGYMIDFWGVGYQVAKRMGIEGPIRAAGYEMERLRSVGPRGEIKADVDVDVFRAACSAPTSPACRAAIWPRRSTPPSRTRSKRSSATASRSSTSATTGSDSGSSAAARAISTC